MNKYINLDEAADLFRGIVATMVGSFVADTLENLPTIEVSEKVENERCKGCKHYKLACDLFSEICKYEPITQIETQNLNENSNEDAISRAYLEQEIENQIMPPIDKEGYWRGWNNALQKVVELIEDAPSVIPTNENEIKLCRNCDNAYLYQDCLYCDEIEEETEIEPDDACSLWKLRESSVKPKEGEWIPCSERLPEENICKSYLIAWIPANEKVKCGLPHYYQVADWEDGDWANLDFCEHEEIVILAWMPLPEPWKGADDE